uniref:DNA damage-inducible transcript 3 protein n=1 Tax=Oryzias sinensis TaxID=183150 RepID=A0A8C7ZVA5_9TELE
MSFLDPFLELLSSSCHLKQSLPVTSRGDSGRASFQAPLVFQSSLATILTNHHLDSEASANLTCQKRHQLIIYSSKITFPCFCFYSPLESLGQIISNKFSNLIRRKLEKKEPEFLDVLESCSLTWLTDGNQSMSESVHRTTEEIHTAQPLHHTSSSSSSSSSCMSPAVAEERQVEADRGRNGDSSTGGSSDLLPPEFFELLSEGGVGTMDSSGAVISSGYYYHHQHHHTSHVEPASPSASEEELPCVPDSPSCSSSASQSPSQNCSPPSSPVSSPSVYLSSRLGKRKRTAGERANSALSPFSSSMQRSPYSSTKKSRKEREQENERKVQELTEQNERLKAEIERLGEEVQRTRRALIERLVNTRK